MRTAAAFVILLLSSTIGFSATINVPGDYPTIQQAIDAAATGDVILVAAGNYTEQLTVDGKIIQIKGASAGQTVVLSPPILQTTFVTSADNKCIVGIINGGFLALSGVTVDGQGLGNSNYRFVGVGFRNSGGVLNFCNIRNIMDTPFSGAQHGVGVYAYNDNGVNWNIKVTKCTIQEYQKNGIALSGPDVTAEVFDCITLGVGQTPTIAQNGIQIGSGASGTVDSCFVYGNCYTGPSWTATGVLLYDGDVVHITNCPNIKDNQTGTYFVTTSGTFVNNTTTAGINAHGDGGYFYGLGIDDRGSYGPAPSAFDDGGTVGGDRSTTVVTVADSVFEADQTGFGLGVGAWAQLSDNVDVDVINCEIRKWTWGVEVWDDTTAVPTVEVYNCMLADNTDYGIVNYTTSPVNAVYNGWGDPTGPFHPTLNPGGLGDPVSDNVIFDPWLTGAESFFADSYILDANENESVSLSLDAGAGNGGRNYIILGSLSGTSPGIALPGGTTVLPVNWDLFTGIMLSLINTPFFQNFSGTLNVDGTGTAVFNVPALSLLPITGQKFYFAYALDKPWDFASNPVILYILP